MINILQIADGQEIAIRLTKQVNHQAAKIRKLLEAYNTGIEVPSLPNELNMENVSDIVSLLNTDVHLVIACLET